MGYWWNVVRHPIVTKRNDDYAAWSRFEEFNVGGVGNPPECTDRDKAIAEFAEQWPEVSGAERDQLTWEADHSGYGPGCTEPPFNWCGEDHPKDWTFTEWVSERGQAYDWDPADAAKINGLYPQDDREDTALCDWLEARQAGRAQAHKVLGEALDDYYRDLRADYTVSRETELEAGQ